MQFIFSWAYLLMSNLSSWLRPARNIYQLFHCKLSHWDRLSCWIYHQRNNKIYRKCFLVRVRNIRVFLDSVDLVVVPLLILEIILIILIKYHNYFLLTDNKYIFIKEFNCLRIVDLTHFWRAPSCKSIIFLDIFNRFYWLFSISIVEKLAFDVLLCQLNSWKLCCILAKSATIVSCWSDMCQRLGLQTNWCGSCSHNCIIELIWLFPFLILLLKNALHGMIFDWLK